MFYKALVVIKIKQNGSYFFSVIYKRQFIGSCYN